MTRIQRQRTRGWRMPAGAVYVGRPTKWGNPWTCGPFALDLYRQAATGCWDPRLVERFTDGTVRAIYATHQAWLKRIGGHPLEVMQRELGDATALACWCKVGAPCHADELIRLLERRRAEARPTRRAVLAARELAPVRLTARRAR